MSDLVQAVSEALSTPAELVRRSAAARAEANGSSVDDVLSAWSGGQPVASSAPPPSVAAPEVEAAVSEPTPAPAAPAAVLAPVAVEAPPFEVEEVEDEPLDPAPLADRLRLALRVGGWTGAALGIVGFLVGTAFWAKDATALADVGPAIQVNPNSLMITLALLSVVFGAVVAGVSRSAAAWANPAMELSASKTSTAWLGGGLGLVLGLVAAAILSGIGTAVEGAEPAITQLPVLPTFIVFVIGGAILGAATALIPQALGVPVAIADEDREEVTAVRARLGNAMGIPLAGLLLLLILVLPFAWALIQSNHLAPGTGGAIVAIIAASGILGFAALAGTRPEMKITMGDFVWALAGIGVVLLIVIATLLATGEDDHGEEDHGESTAIVKLI